MNLLGPFANFLPTTYLNQVILIFVRLEPPGDYEEGAGYQVHEQDAQQAVHAARQQG